MVDLSVLERQKKEMEKARTKLWPWIVELRFPRSGRGESLGDEDKIKK